MECYCCCCRDDEHLLIQHYCQSLNQGSPLSQPQSPAQILISMESEEKGELERVLNDLEQENRFDCMAAFFTIQMIGFKMKYNELKLDYISPAVCQDKPHLQHFIKSHILIKVPCFRLVIFQMVGCQLKIFSAKMQCLMQIIKPYISA